MRYAAVEGGGTTFVCGIAVDSPDNIINRVVIPTTDPETTLGEVRKWLQSQTFDAVGIASFGPIDAKLDSATYGHITSTPKPKWKNTNVIQMLGMCDEFKHIPHEFDTDVNAPAMAEYVMHCQKLNMKSCAYITVGTGIGVGIVANGETVKGLMHPEAGHIQTKRCRGDSFTGTCPFHGDCVEGMCSTGALIKRAQCTQSDLPNLGDDDIVWEHTAYYIAQLCATLIMVASPERIAIGGGVLNRKSLYPKIHKYTLEILNGYIVNDQLTPETIANYITPSFWSAIVRCFFRFNECYVVFREGQAGLVGAAFLAQRASVRVTPVP